MIKKLAIITGIDIVFIAALVQAIDPDQSVSIGIIYFVPFLIIINLVVALILKISKSTWVNVVLINSIISAVIFSVFFIYIINKKVSDRYKSFYFFKDSKNFELIFNVVKEDYVDNEKFEVYGIGEGSSWGIGLAGTYSVKGDTLILLTDSSKTMKVSNNILFDYPNVGDTIKLRTK